MRYLLLSLLAMVGLMLPSCIEDDFTTSSSDILTFSTDTLSFDTVFTDLGTPTARLLVYNRASKSVNISSIRFKNANSHFSMNVDGQAGNIFRDVEIRGGDSIYVFVECYIPAGQGAEPALVEDQIEFVTNGVTQNVQVEAWGQNVIRLRNQRITADTRFSAEMPIVVFDSLVVEKGATLSVSPGTKLLFHDKASLTVRGTIEAVGEPGKMIEMRGDRLDNVLPNVGYDILAGQWSGMNIAPESFENRLEYVDMRSTTNGLRIDSCGDTSRRKLLLRNSWLHNSQTNVLESKYARVDAYGCCFSESPDNVVALYGGQHSFVQCTIANNYLFAPVSQPLLGLYHCLPDSQLSSLPLMQASFENCIIYGLGGDINTGDLTGSQVYLRYVMLKSAGSDDDNFINCFWDSDPMFLTVRQDYIFNYRLRNDSPAIAVGNPSFVTSLCRYDMDGLDRLANGNPDLGAYVWVWQPDSDK